MTAKTLLDLGRVSNLPTVWTNVLAGAVLSRASLEARPLLVLGTAASLLYIGGMFLNDAFDRQVDARLRPERPIPSGRATARFVFVLGFALLASGVILVGAAWRLRAIPGVSGSEWAPLMFAAALAGLIVLYDAFHKGRPLSVVIMGLCRAFLYLTAAVTLGTLTWPAAFGASLLLIYVVGLSLVARREGVNPRVRGLVGPLIAGICLLDAALIGFTGAWAIAAIAALGFPLTLAGQRYVKGT